MIYVFLKYLFSLVFFPIWRPVVHNKKALRARGKAIIIANHRSACDPILIGLLTPRPIHFMGKEELFKNPISRFFFKQILVFPVKRKSADLKSVKKAIEHLDKGHIFGIFPEGTRAITDEVDTFEKGAAFLALCSDAPVIPVFIPNSTYEKPFHRLHFYVGTPIIPADYKSIGKRSDIVEAINYDMENAIAELKAFAKQDVK